MNQFNHFFQQFTTQLNWSEFVFNLFTKICSMLMITLLFLILKHLINRSYQSRFSHFLMSKQLKASPQRLQTISKVTQNALTYLLYFFYAYILLSIIGIPVTTLLAGAGIVSVALGLGIKDFIADAINGFFIILEGQYEVGEFITIGEISGTVIQVGIRTTILQSAAGNRYYIPNGDIAIVNNHSRDNMRVMIELPINQATPLEQFISCIQTTTQQISESYQTQLTAEPNLLGFNRDKYGNFNYTIIFFVMNGQQAKLTGEFYQIYLRNLQQETIAFPPHYLPFDK